MPVNFALFAVSRLWVTRPLCKEPHDTWSLEEQLISLLWFGALG